MRYVRPFSLDGLAPGVRSDWLIAPTEEAGCALRLARGGGAPADVDGDVIALVLAGNLQLECPAERAVAAPGSLVIVPAGAGRIGGGKDSYWIEIATDLSGADKPARVVPIDHDRFIGSGFAYQSLADRSTGVDSMKINTLQVQPGAGSPDFHIHAFAQIYIIQEGEMTIEIGRVRHVAPAHSIVFLPPGVVHRNFNASPAVERHVSLLVPEPREDEIFDFAVEIHPQEAELMTGIPG